jgi:hypothetical protein
VYGRRAQVFQQSSFIARIPTGIAESSATKFVAWLIPEIVPGLCVSSAKKNAGGTCAKYAKSSAAITGGDAFTLAGRRLVGPVEREPGLAYPE